MIGWSLRRESLACCCAPSEQWFEIPILPLASGEAAGEAQCPLTVLRVTVIPASGCQHIGKPLSAAQVHPAESIKFTVPTAVVAHISSAPPLTSGSWGCFGAKYHSSVQDPPDIDPRNAPRGLGYTSI